jgi:hypothetical protein
MPNLTYRLKQGKYPEGSAATSMRIMAQCCQGETCLSRKG